MFSGRKICGKLFHMRGKLEAPPPTTQSGKANLMTATSISETTQEYIANLVKTKAVSVMDPSESDPHEVYLEELERTNDGSIKALAFAYYEDSRYRQWQRGYRVTISATNTYTIEEDVEYYESF